MKYKIQSKLGAISFAILLLFVITDYLKKPTNESPDTASSLTVEEAYNSRQSNVQVLGSGTVIKLLADDLQGSRHQKFLVRAADRLTILIAHNIDLAPRINTLKRGGQIAFFGEYEWNQKGGVVHWTHHDPRKRHPEGWLEYQGEIYK